MGFPKDDYRIALRKLTDVHPDNIIWDGEPEPFIIPVPGEYVGHLTLSLTAAPSIGTHDVIRDATSTTLLGWRIATISHKLELFGAEEAYDELDRLRLRMRRPSFRAALRACGLALVDSPSLTNLDGVVDNRATSVATLDVRFAYQITDVLTDEDFDGFIESAEDPVGPTA